MSALAPQVLLSAQSLAASFNSSATMVLNNSGVMFTVSWSGSAVGTITVQVSGDGYVFAPLDITAGVLNNATDSWTADIIVTAGVFLRLSYTRTSGTGTMNASVAAKG